MRIWEFTDYRKYLVEKLGGRGSRTGLRKKMAEAISVHTTFVSQVMQEKAEFSLEQSEAINEFLGHSEDEGEYFLLLVMRARAGSASLKERFDKQIQAFRDERLNIKKRIEAKDSVSQLDRERFYSSYLYGAIHVLSTLPGINTVEAMADRLKIPKAVMQEMVDFMIRIGVLVEKDNQIISGSTHVHLEGDSKLVTKHHSNWRLHCLHSLQFPDPKDLHYSACLTLSKEDAFRVKESILANLKENVGIISASKEEVAYVMNLDFYHLLR